MDRDPSDDKSSDTGAAKLSAAGLQGGDHLLRAILDNLADGVITIDERGLIQSFSAAAEKMFGYSCDEAIGQNIAMLMEKTQADQHDHYLQNYLETGRSKILGVGPREVIGKRKDGSTFPVDLAVSEIQLGEGHLFIGAARDISRRKAIEREIKGQSLLLETTMATMAQGFVVYDSDLRLIAFNAQYERMFEYPSGFLTSGMSMDEVIRNRGTRRLNETDNSKEDSIKRYIERAKDTVERTQERELSNGLVYVYHRKPMPEGGFITTFTDITERKLAEREAARKAALLGTTLENMGHGFCVFDVERKLVAFNRKYVDLFDFPEGLVHIGMNHEELVRHHAKKGHLGEEGGDIEERVRRRVDGAKLGLARTSESTLPGGTHYVYSRMPLPDGGFVATYTDITERKRMEREAVEISALGRAAIANMAQGFCVFDAEARLKNYNKKFAELFDFPPDFLHLGITFEEISRFRAERGDYGEGDVDTLTAEALTRFDDPTQRTREFKLRSGIVYVHHREPMPGGGWVQTYTDITERKKAEQQVAEKSSLLEATFQNMVQGIAVFDAEHTLGAFNSQFADIMGLPPNFLHVGMNRADIIRYRAINGYYGEGEVEAIVADSLARGALEQSGEQAIIRDGRSYTYERTPMADGSYISTVTDITERKRAEEQLQQAQKMEAVGQLTGGIAHDFNNLLAVSLGNIELAEEVAREGGDVGPFLETVKRASERGASLTSQLLAFSRKQTLFPQTIDAGDLLAGMTGLLRSALEETIEIKVTGADDLWPCKADPHQLESAVLNLALNARDAMESGGTLTIETTNAHLDDDYAAAQAEMEPGEYVQVAVNDTGIGMAQDVIDHAFDPFFTTKGVGEGSGLGLSMVYGFAKQSGGHVTVYSEEGKGTTIRLYLPRSDAAEGRLDEAEQTGAPQAHGETVLVVEDDPEVRTLAVALLSSFGYEIQEAADGASALKALDSMPKADLLFTDVVLPGGISGPELAAEVRERFPGMAVLYTSGYTDLANIDQSAFAEGTELLQKPYRKVDLARKVRLVLDGGRA